MQTILTYFVLLFTGLYLQAQTGTIEVTITDFSSNDGTALIGLYNSEDSFLESRYKGASEQIENNIVKVIFTDIPAGTYAISIIHDENDNKKFDMTMGVIPAEPYATSNNAKGFFGPPKWEDASFEVKEGQTKSLTISF